MTSIQTRIIGTAAATSIPLTQAGAISGARTATGGAITATYSGRFRTATAAALAANVGDYIWFHGEGAGTGGGYYGWAVMTQKNATIDGVATQDEYTLVGQWGNVDPTKHGAAPPTSATLSTWRISTGTQPAPIIQSFGKIVIESIVCPRNTTVGAGTLTLTELANTVSGLSATPIVFSVQTAATFSAVSLPLPADGITLSGPFLIATNAATSDWIITWRGVSANSLSRTARFLSVGGSAL